MKFQVWYMKPEWFRDGICYKLPDPANLEKTHVHLKDVEAGNDRYAPMESVWLQMQGENWSPNGEARPLIEAKGLRHTSMSVGDVLIDEAGGIHVAAWAGFKQL
jgi:hypothetical protein